MLGLTPISALPISDVRHVIVVSTGGGFRGAGKYRLYVQAMIQEQIAKSVLDSTQSTAENLLVQGVINRWAEYEHQMNEIRKRAVHSVLLAEL